jgi:hypothetical protein
MTTRMVRALGLVPFGMYLRSGREINSLTCKEVVDCLVNEYDGQQRRTLRMNKTNFQYRTKPPNQTFEPIYNLALGCYSNWPFLVFF